MLPFRQFQRNVSSLFDVAVCKCSTFTDCNYPKESKVPFKLQTFLADQRTKRLMCIGSLDLQDTKKLQTRPERKTKNSFVVLNLLRPAHRSMRPHQHQRYYKMMRQWMRNLMTTTTIPDCRLHPLRKCKGNFQIPP